ncbi:MAG: rRNA pseudouridine synthase [Anaerolineae bacterium]|nr:rRNA pseudouridine synthase [Anaerolineae bacterium]
MEERLQKIMARAGLGSRRACEDLIRAGRVAVNGVVAQLGHKADINVDRVTVDGREIAAGGRKVYVALYKPRGVLSDAGDGSGQVSTVLDLVPLPGHVFPVGRLDLRSEGLILLTNDGDLAYRLTHPSFGHEKEYKVLVEGAPSEDVLERWRRGVFLDGRRTAPAEVSFAGRQDDSTWLRVVLHEGRKRQIRRVAAMLGCPAHRLIRVRIATLRLGNLAPGQWRNLTDAEVRTLKESVKRRQKRT